MLSFRSTPSRRHLPHGVAPFMLAVLFPFHMHVRTIGNNGRGLLKCKNGKPARLLAD